MTKDLKKLSRVELLELLISLSEDYDALERENDKLKKMVSNQRLPRSTKVGSIADAALKANGYFDAVQRSADEYLREIKHLRDELALRANEDARRSPVQTMPPDQVRALVDDAEARADRIIAQANSRAEAILANARSQAEHAVASANRESHAILSQANREAAALMTAARQESRKRIQIAQATAEQVGAPTRHTGSQADARQSEAPATPTGAAPVAQQQAVEPRQHVAEQQPAPREERQRTSPMTTGEILKRGRHLRQAAEGGTA